MAYAWHALLPLLVILRGGDAARIAVPSPITDVLRGDRMSPEEVKAQGGFLSAAKNMSYPSLYDYTVNTECDLLADCQRDYFYLRTTTDPDVESSFLGNQPGYIYHIRATPNFIELRSTLPTLNTGPRSKEVAVFGDIRWDQVTSWDFLPNGENTATQDQKHTMNNDYNPDMSSFSASTQQFQLAGFPANHDGWKEAPWSDYQASFSSAKAAEEEAIKFLKKSSSTMHQNSLFGISVSAILRRITLISEAVNNSTDWIRRNDDAAACGFAARQAQRNANVSSSLVKHLAMFLDSHRYPEVQALRAARALEFRTRGAAFVSMQWAEKKSLIEYERRIDLRKENIMKGIAGANVQAMSAMIDATLAQELVNKTTNELRVKRSKVALLTSVPTLVDDLACAVTLESCDLALQSELEALRLEIIILKIHSTSSQEATDRMKRTADETMSLALNKVSEQGTTAVAAENIKESIETVSKEDSVLSTPEEVSKTVEMIATIEKLDDRGMNLVEDITYAVVEIGFFVLGLIPTPFAPIFHVAAWARRIYRIYKYASRMAKAYKVGKLGYMSVDLMQKIAELEARTADALQRADRQPPPLAAAYMAAQKPNATFLSILTQLDATTAGNDWKQELESATGLRIVDDGKLAKSFDVELSAGKDKHFRLKQVQELLQTAKAFKSDPAAEPLTDKALVAFERITSGGKSVQKTLLNSLDEEQAAGHVASPRENEDDFHYSYVVQ